MVCSPGRPKLAAAMAAAMLGFVSAGCHAVDPPKPTTSTSSAMPDTQGADATTTALLAELEKQPGRVLRAIATIRPGLQAREQAIASLQSAGASTIQEVPGRPLLVIEVNFSQLRALLGSGQLVSVQPDTPVPIN